MWTNGSHPSRTPGIVLTMCFMFVYEKGVVFVECVITINKLVIRDADNGIVSECVCVVVLIFNIAMLWRDLGAMWTVVVYKRSGCNLLNWHRWHRDLENGEVRQVGVHLHMCRLVPHHRDFQA